MYSVLKAGENRFQKHRAFINPEVLTSEKSDDTHQVLPAAPTFGAGSHLWEKTYPELIYLPGSEGKELSKENKVETQWPRTRSTKSELAFESGKVRA